MSKYENYGRWCTACPQAAQLRFLRVSRPNSSSLCSQQLPRTHVIAAASADCIDPHAGDSPALLLSICTRHSEARTTAPCPFLGRQLRYVDANGPVTGTAATVVSCHRRGEHWLRAMSHVSVVAERALTGSWCSVRRRTDDVSNNKLVLDLKTCLSFTAAYSDRFKWPTCIERINQLIMKQWMLVECLHRRFICENTLLQQTLASEHFHCQLETDEFTFGYEPRQ
jgi:hypothetical protein